MDIINFFNSDKCPICGNNLKLCMQISDGPMWTSKKKLNSKQYSFKQAFIKNKEYIKNFNMIVEDNELKFKFNSAKLYQGSKTWDLFFFYICNEKGIVSDFDDDYNINVYDACYYKASEFFSFKKDNDKWNLTFTDQSLTNKLIRVEMHVINQKDDSLYEKVYIINNDYENNITQLKYYGCSKEERDDKYFVPKTFEKEFPLLSYKLDFSPANREVLLNKFNTWITMS